MNCLKCGAFNEANFKFCIKCGNALEAQNVQNQSNESKPLEQPTINGAPVQQPIGNGVPIQQPINQVAEQPVLNQLSQQEPTPNNNLQEKKSTKINYFKYMIAILTKPFETFKQHEEDLTDTKVALSLGGIVTGVMMIVNLLISMVSVIFTKTMDYTTFKYKTSIDFSQLSNLNYVDLIFKNLLIYIGVILVITVVYYIASLVFKKSLNFIKTLSITTSSLIPFIVLGMIISPILGKIWAPLSIVIKIIGLVYAVIIFITLINDNINFEKKDMNIYFHALCLGIIAVAGYYLYVNILTSGITNEINNYLDFFKGF